MAFDRTRKHFDAQDTPTLIKWRSMYAGFLALSLFLAAISIDSSWSYELLFIELIAFSSAGYSGVYVYLLENIIRTRKKENPLSDFKNVTPEQVSSLFRNFLILLGIAGPKQSPVKHRSIVRNCFLFLGLLSVIGVLFIYLAIGGTCSVALTGMTSSDKGIRESYAHIVEDAIRTRLGVKENVPLDQNVYTEQLQALVNLCKSNPNAELSDFAKGL
jgi:hypothetical protein